MDNLPNPAIAEPQSIWHYKPWWCQPWSILLTGFGIIFTSWLLFHRLWLTGLVAIPILLWMGYFLLVYPQLAMSSGLSNEMDEAIAPLSPPTQDYDRTDS